LTIRHATPLVACALTLLGAGCQGYSTDFATPVAIAIATTRIPPFVLEELDTMRVSVVVLDRAGDTVPGQAVRLLSLDPDTLAVDSAIFGLVGVVPGAGRVVASSGNLQSAPLTVNVVRAPDSLAVYDSTARVDTVASTDSVSAPLIVQLLDARTDSGQVIGLGWADTIHFAITYPLYSSRDSAKATLGNDSLSAAVTTALAPAGTAQVVVRLQGTPRPDSVVVQATAHRAVGTVVKGSPVTFVVRFQ